MRLIVSPAWAIFCSIVTFFFFVAPSISFSVSAIALRRLAGSVTRLELTRSREGVAIAAARFSALMSPERCG